MLVVSCEGASAISGMWVVSDIDDNLSHFRIH